MRVDYAENGCHCWLQPCSALSSPDLVRLGQVGCQRLCVSVSACCGASQMPLPHAVDSFAMIPAKLGEIQGQDGPTLSSKY